MPARSAVAAFCIGVVLSVGVLCTNPGTAVAQNERIHHTIVKQHLSPPSMGREFWFSMLSNYWGLDDGGKYMRIYITSPKNTTAYVQLGNTGKVPITIEAYKIGMFIIPEEWEMESSGVVEQKSIHVWSNDADLTVYDMSHNYATSDGSFIFPTIGWGTDYVVAGYASLFEESWDDPSEFSVTANTDNTTVTITPSCDFRLCAGGNESGDGCSSIVGYRAGVPFTVQLNRGDDVEFKPVLAQGADGYDVTGTIIHSNNPVGVNCGSDCPNIPADYAYCDHVEEMVPPVRTWAETYYTTNFKAPPQQPASHDFGLYLMISSKPGQIIYRQDAASGKRVECQLNGQYDTYWDELELAQKFWSDAPFLLVEYINSASYPDHINGIGDPAEIVINPREDFSKTVIFQAPVSGGKQLPYTSYASIIVNKKDENKTLFDNQKISAYTKESVDDTFDVFTASNIGAGTHTVTGDDSGVGVYVYGYAWDESYGWAGSFGNGTFQAKDTVAPLADTMGSCYAATIHVTDSGINPGGIPQSKLATIRLDTDYNMAYIINPDWHDGTGADTGGYSMFVLDKTKPAYLQVDAFDLAGNATTVTSIYTPQVAQIDPPLQDLGASIAGQTKYAYDTIINTGQVPFKFDQLSFLYNNVGFSIDSGMSPQVLAVGEKRIIKIAFTAVKPTLVVDSILFGDECGIQSVAVTGSGGSADFLVSDQDWPNEVFSPPSLPTKTGYIKTVKIENLSQIPITIDGATWPDTHFVAVDTFPFTVPKTDPKTLAPGVVSFRIAYFPDANSVTTPNRTQGSWTSPSINPDGSEATRKDSLVGNGIAPTVTFIQDIDTTIECAQPGDMLHLTFQIADAGSAGGTVQHVYHTDSNDFINLLGTLSNGNTWNPGDASQSFAPGQSATISLDYPEPAGTNVTAVDNLIAIDGEGDTVGGHPIRVTVHMVYRAGQVQPPGIIDFGTTPYQNQLFPSKTFFITNSTQVPLTVSSIPLQAGGAYNNSFTITTVPPMPDTIQPGARLQVTVTFNDSLSFDAVQTAELGVNWDGCAPQTMSVTAAVSVSGAVSKGYIPTPILSCDQTTINDTVIDNQPHNATTADYVYDTVISATWIGANHGANFAPITGLNNTVIRSGDSLFIPITFLPGSQKGLVTYTDSLQVILRNDRGIYDTVVQANSGIAGTALVSASSLFATDSGAASDGMSVPATITLNKQGLTLPATQMDITGIELTYVISHPDMLIPNKPNPFAIDPKLTALGWTSQPDPVPGTRSDSVIRVKLSGPNPLDDNFTNPSTVGQLQFQVALDKSDSATPVTLQSIQLYTGASASTPVGTCIDTAVTSSGFSLILRCGDATLRGLMNGQGVIDFIQPATPDPVTGSTVTFRYANRGETNITLAIYDILGHEVARPIDNVNHEAGAWQVSYDVSKLPSGTYTYRLSSSNAMGQTALSKQFVIQH